MRFRDGPVIRKKRRAGSHRCDTLYLEYVITRRLSGIVLFASLGCYAAVPLTTPAPQTGSEVVVQLTDAGSESLARLVGPRATEIRGHYLASPPDTLRVAVLGVTTRNEEERFWQHEPLGIPRSAIATLRERRLSTPRTAAVVALAAAAAVLVKIGFGGSPGTTGSHQGPPAGQ